MVELSNRSPRMKSSDFGLNTSGFATNEWAARLQENQSFEQCLDEGFWMDVVTKILGDDKTNTRGLMDTVVALKADTMQKVYYMITGIGPGRMKLVEQQRFSARVARELAPNSPLLIKWNPGKKGHEVYRKNSENGISILAGPYPDKNDAVDWIDNHLKAMAA